MRMISTILVSPTYGAICPELTKRSAHVFPLSDLTSRSEGNQGHTLKYDCIESDSEPHPFTSLFVPTMVTFVLLGFALLVLIGEGCHPAETVK